MKQLESESFQMPAKVLDLPRSTRERLRTATLRIRSDVEYAVRESKLLLDEGDEDAYPLAGLAHEKKGDFESAAFYYQRGMETIGATECWLGKARLNLAGMGAPQDYAEAKRCYAAVLEDTDNPVAPLMLGLIYRHGLGVTPDPVVARKFIMQAAGFGSISAIAHLAELEGYQGRWLRGFLLRIKSGLLAWIAMMRNPADVRLRSDFAMYREAILSGAVSPG